MPQRRHVALLLATLPLATLGRAAAAPPDLTPAMTEAAARRFPQPVRAGDLLGRAVLQPTEAQPVLGHVAALARRADGGTTVLIRAGGPLGFGSRLVAVPVEAIALLGEHVALMALTPEAFAALPTAIPPPDALPPDTTIRVGIVRPFH